MANEFEFVCPICRGQLERPSDALFRCPQDALTFPNVEGIWRFLPPARADDLAQFRQEYETVRREEGRGRDDSHFYRELPYFKRDHPHFDGFQTEKAGWQERARSFETLLETVIRPFEMAVERPLRILDLGAGNGWLANRLAARGHLVAAVDLGTNAWDGLGAHPHYETQFKCVQAEFDHLPLAPNQAELIIFNASLHYSVAFGETLREAGRVLQPNGCLVVMDTAVYKHQTSGEQMVAEREAAFLQTYGFASNALPNENFLTFTRIAQLGQSLDLQWQLNWTLPLWRRSIRKLKVAVKRQREPAQFPLILFFANDMPKPLNGPRLLGNQFEKIGRNTGWLMLARVGQQAVLLLFTALVARQLGESGLGQLAWVTAVLYLGNVVSTWGLDTMLLRQIGATRQTAAAPLAAGFTLELILAAIFILLIFLLPFGEQVAETVAGLRLYSLVLLPLALLTIISAALRGYEQMGGLAALTLGTAVLQVAGTAVLFAVGGGFVGLMGWLLVVQMLSAGAGWWLCRRMLPDFHFYWSRFQWPQVWALAKGGVWLALLVGTAVLLQRLGIFLLGWLGTEAQIGQLAAASRFVEAARLFPGALMGALFPVLAKNRAVQMHAKSEMPKAQTLFTKHQVALLGYGVAAAIGLWLLASPLVNFLFGDGYETAVPLLKTLAWGMIPFSLSLPLSVELVVAERERRVLLATVVALVATAVLAFLAYGQQDLPGVAVGLVIGEWILLLLLFAARNWRYARNGRK